MKLTIQKKVGNNTYDFSFEGKDLWECLMESQKISIHDLSKCGSCESPYIKLFAYETKEDKYKYIKVSCPQCKSSLTLGQSKKDNAYYYRRNETTKALDWQKTTENHEALS